MKPDLAFLLTGFLKLLTNLRETAPPVYEEKTKVNLDPDREQVSTFKLALTV